MLIFLTENLWQSICTPLFRLPSAFIFVIFSSISFWLCFFSLFSLLAKWVQNSCCFCKTIKLTIKHFSYMYYYMYYYCYYYHFFTWGCFKWNAFSFCLIMTNKPITFYRYFFITSPASRRFLLYSIIYNSTYSVEWYL